MKFKRFSLLIVVAALCVMTTAIFAAETESLSLGGVKGEVTVKFDEYGIPSIYASSIRDAFYVQGYLHASNRMWQMDMTRRRVMGRRAEIFGEKNIDGDLQAYIARFPQVSKKVWEECSPEECEAYQAYSDGVNEYINTVKELPEEYVKLGITPDKWTPIDSIAVGRGVSWALSSDIGLEVALGVISKLIGTKALMDLLPLDGVDPTSMLGADEFSSFPAQEMSPDTLELLNSEIVKMGRTEFGSVVGSNNWVVSGSRTASGNPILSNDTHMGLGNPSDWYELMINAPGLHVVGLSFPGAPGFLIGHNENIAWGVTTARYDVTDAYILRLDMKNPDNYFYKGESIPFEVEKVNISYKTDEGMKVAEKQILNSVYGPVVYEKERPVNVIAFRWTGHEPTHEARAFFGCMTANNLDDFKEALSHFEVGAQNFVYADVKGNIYYRSQGKIPKRHGKPFLPLDGSSGKYGWEGYVPYENLPHLENPARGYVVTANNRQASNKYPEYLGALYDKGYRARRITDLIEGTDKMTFEKMQEIQADVYSLAAENMLPLLNGAVETHPGVLTPDAQKALEILNSWDKYDRTDAVGPSIFYKWIKSNLINILKDNVPGEIFGNVGRSEVIYPILLNEKKLSFNVYDDTRTSDVVETKEDMMVKSLNDAVVELKRLMGDDMSAWTWGKLHTITLGHDLGGEFNLGPEPTDGGTDSVNVTSYDLLGDKFNVYHGPNMRMTVELAPGRIHGKNVIAGGQSGDRKSPNNSDQFHMWLKKETHEMLFYDDEVNAHTVKTLVIAPVN